MLNEKSPIQALLSLLQEVYYLGSDERGRLVDACLLHAEGIVTCTNHVGRKDKNILKRAAVIVSSGSIPSKIFLFIVK